MARKLDLRVGDFDELDEGSVFPNGNLDEGDTLDFDSLGNDLLKTIQSINKGEGSAGDKLDRIQSAILKVTPFFVGELKKQAPESDKAVIGSKLVTALNTAAGLVKSKNEIQASAEIDVNNPKFDLIVKWWFEIALMVARDVLPPEHVNLFFKQLAVRFEGWQGKVSKALKEVSQKELNSMANPLLSGEIEEQVAQIEKESRRRDQEDQIQFENMMKGDKDKLH